MQQWVSCREKPGTCRLQGAPASFASDPQSIAFHPPAPKQRQSVTSKGESPPAPRTGLQLMQRLDPKASDYIMVIQLWALGVCAGCILRLALGGKGIVARKARALL